jgi:hypothetical protein
MSKTNSTETFSEVSEHEKDQQDHWPVPSICNQSTLILPISITKLKLECLCSFIQLLARERYGDKAKEIQLKLVMDLVEQKTYFVLAGTGFGKTRIAEMYWHLFTKGKKATILCLNPQLDSLGDNQVSPKAKK